MCGQVGQLISDAEFDYWLEKNGLQRVQLKLDMYTTQSEAYASHRIFPGKKAVIITNEGVLDAEFAYNREYKGKKRYLFNVRCEGGFRNKQNRVDYDGPWDIFTNPYVSDVIFTQRCVIPVNLFIEQPEDKKLKKKYVVRRADHKLFYLGGNYIQDADGSFKFVIYTMPATKATLVLGHHRSPLYIHERDIKTWINPETPQEQVESLFKLPSEVGFEVFEVDVAVSKRKPVVPWNEGDERWITAIDDVITV